MINLFANFKKSLILLTFIFSVILLNIISCSTNSSDNSANNIMSITVIPNTTITPVGVVKQFSAVATYNNNITQDVTAQATWASSNSTVASVSNSNNTIGEVTPLVAGNTIISASLNGTTGTSPLTVSAATLTNVSITSVINSNTLDLGTGEQLLAEGIFSDGTKQDITMSVTWSVDQPSLASISNSPGSIGFITSIAAGVVNVTATVNKPLSSTTIKRVHNIKKIASISTNFKITISSSAVTSIQITPVNATLALNTKQQYTAMAILANGTKQDITKSVVWSEPSGLINSSGGLFNASVVKNTSITAILNNYLSGSTNVSIIAPTLTAIQISPTKSTLPLSLTSQFTAIGIYSNGLTQNITNVVTWSSSAPKVAIINSANNSGLVTPLTAGTTIISASFNGVISAPSTLTVNNATLQSIQISPVNSTITLSQTKQFTAIGIYSDSSAYNLTNLAVWNSATPATATISNANNYSGIATPVAGGTTLISASFNGVTSPTTTLTVSNVTLRSIQVTPTNISTPLGVTQQFTAIGIYSDNSTQNLTALATWSSSQTSVAIVSNPPLISGSVTPIATGMTSITATFNSVSGSTNLTVTAPLLKAIQITPPNATIPIGLTQQLIATGIYSDNSTQNLTNLVTWTSSQIANATISNVPGSNGLVTTLATGTSIITATLGSISSTTNLTISSPSIVSIQITPATLTLAAGLTQQFAAIGIYSDNTEENITNSVTWTSSQVSYATISNLSGSIGLATTISAGSTTITASLGSINGSVTLTISPPTLNSITISSTKISTPLGITQQFTAIGNYSDGSTPNITTLVTWASTTTATATVSNAPTTNGLVTPVATGITSISASYGGINSNNVTFTVTQAILSSIAVTPANTTVAAGLTQQYTATGTYSDGSTQNITTSVLWSSSSLINASISNASGSNGLASTFVAGTTAITASLGSITSSSANLIISSALLQTITVTPLKFPLTTTGNVQYTAIGNYSDNTTENITSAVLWSSSNTAVATISNAAGSNGLANGVTTGSANISATLGSITSNSVTVNVTFLYNRIYVPNYNGNTLLMATINPITGAYASSFNNTGAVNLNGPLGATFYNNYAYIGNNGNNTTTACQVNLSTGLITSCASAVSSALFVSIITSIGSNNNFIYGTTAASGLVVYGTVSGTNINYTGSTPGFSAPWGVGFNNNYAYVANSVNNTISVCQINTTSGALQNCNQISGNFNSPQSVSFYNGFLYTANTNNNTISVCSINSTNGYPINCQLTGNGANLNNPTAVAFDNGFAYVLSPNNSSIMTFSVDVNTGLLTYISTITSTSFAVANQITVQ